MSASTRKQVLILGGGFGGLYTALSTDTGQVILANINAFVGNRVPQDDQTLVIARLETSQMRQIPPVEMESVFEPQMFPM